MTPTTASMPLAAGTSSAKPVRMFGRFQLLRLIGKSARSMVWLALDTRNQQECMLAIPRTQPDPDSAASGQDRLRRAARLSHPQLAPAIEVGVQDRWPYVAYDRGNWVTWAERFGRQGIPATEAARWTAQAAQGLAFAHEAGVAHQDLQPWMLLVDENDNARVIGLEVAGRAPAATGRDAALDELRATRDAAATDVLALGLVLHQALGGQPALEEADVGRVIERMPPLGNDIVRLPWSVPRPVPDPLRAIVNRATDRQERQRYRNARTLQRALEGWLKVSAEQEGGPLALLLDRLRAVGVLPAQPGGAERVAHMALLERGRTSELAEIVIDDLALTFELLRQVNVAQVHGAQVSGDGPVLMLRRAIAMLGLEGVRRAALSLRPWPGPMNDEAAAEMAALIRRVKRAGRVAVRLAPAGYDPEVTMLIALMQNLGRLVVQYHFPEESAQIRRLIQPSEASAEGAAADPGMSAEAASFAVLGADVEELGLAVARHWGLDESVLHMIRRLAPTAPVRHPDGDNDMLRTTASCANDLVEALAQPARRVNTALNAVASRYARALNITAREMQEALQAESGSVPARGPAGAPPGRVAAPVAGRNSARAA